MECVRIPRSRLREWLRVIEELEEASERLAARLGRVSVLLHGSYARGDFNLWSDIDLIIVSEAFEGIRPLDRYELLQHTLPDKAEPIPMTPRELREAIEKPAWRMALKRGVVIFRDEHGVEELLRERGIEPVKPEQLKRIIRELLETAAPL